MLDQAGSFGEDEADLLPLWMWDVAGEMKLRDKLLISVSGNNLLNQSTIVSWRPYGARPVAPRQIFLGMSFEL